MYFWFCFSVQRNLLDFSLYLSLSLPLSSSVSILVVDAVSVYVPFVCVCVGVADAVSIYALFFHVVSLGCYQFGAVDHVTKPDVRQFYLD